MGACSFMHIKEGFSIDIVFQELRDAAIARHGNDRYNGTISTCDLGRRTGRYAVYTPEIEKQVVAELQANYGAWPKWCANYVDLGVCHYLVYSVKKTNKPYTAKYKQKFVVCEGYGGANLTSYVYDTKPPADKKAMELALQNPKTEYSVRKTMIRLEGDDQVSMFGVECKKYEKMPKKKLGCDASTKIIPVHKYILYGFASC